jgi:hypothetical protein
MMMCANMQHALKKRDIYAKLVGKNLKERDYLVYLEGDGCIILTYEDVNWIQLALDESNGGFL